MCSIILRGGYVEVTPRGRRWCGAGSVVLRGAKASHRLEIDHGRATCAVTLFITGPRFREWGFHCPKGWVRWRYSRSRSGSPRAGSMEHARGYLEEALAQARTEHERLLIAAQFERIREPA